MRKDIELNLQYGDLELGGESPPFFIDVNLKSEDSKYLNFQCESVDPINFDAFKSGVGVSFDRLYTFKTIRMNFVYTNGYGESISTGFKDVLWNGKPLLGCRLPLVDIGFKYRLYYIDGNFHLFPQRNIDLLVNRSIKQNEFLLLVSNVGSIYNEPITGVGLKDYLSSDIVSTNVASKIQEQFKIDGMVVRSMSVFPETGEIEINSDEL